jgi:ATP-dependent 26S proteasome regulatory subunit
VSPPSFVSLQFHAVVGVLTEDADPMVSVMKLEKAPDETYADIGGLDQQIQEIKVCRYDEWHLAGCSKIGLGS